MPVLPQSLLNRLPVVSPGSRSLRRHLLAWLLLPQLVLWLAAALVTHHVAVRYADRAIDHGLYLSSRALARQVKPVDSGLLIDFPRAARDIIESDPDDRVYYMVSSPPGEFILGNHKLTPPADIEALVPERPSFYDARIETPDGEVTVRVAAILLNYGEPGQGQRMMVQVAKSRVSREALARDLLVDTALPLSLLVLAMSALVWAGVRTGLAPLARLREAVSGRGPDDLAPIELESAPEEVRDLAAAVNTLLAAVRDSVAAQQRFIGDAAHQLRTPLAGLKGQTELALKETSDPALQARLQRVHESATRSAHLINQLMTLARAEPESVARIGRSRFDLRRLVQELTAELVPRALADGRDLGMDEPEDGDEPPPLVLDGNALLIREAIANLIDNAIRYAGRGAEITVRVREDGARRRAIVEVDDTGPGIPEALHGAIFERFFRGTNEGRGCGLGLAIVREIVERHHGRVQVARLNPHGTRMSVLLPLTDPAGAPPAGT
ncbi:sensor histidine kinase [Sphaerotilus uruguayifluvii]|uniref:histidine kinase n=1 Tax=Sphaerotilus uruguayifluvii TaxID=2735897 RepID=A0ABX2G8G6_9BURK|nr:sensor histidine kinase [Leptothrix sp. C29]NRT57717.1 two-component system sensor histidine kinase TctE [Leptothrix sp. C29]